MSACVYNHCTQFGCDLVLDEGVDPANCSGYVALEPGDAQSLIANADWWNIDTDGIESIMAAALVAFAVAWGFRLLLRVILNR